MAYPYDIYVTHTSRVLLGEYLSKSSLGLKVASQYKRRYCVFNPLGASSYDAIEHLRWCHLLEKGHLVVMEQKFLLKDL